MSEVKRKNGRGWLRPIPPADHRTARLSGSCVIYVEGGFWLVFRPRQRGAFWREGRSSLLPQASEKSEAGSTQKAQFNESAMACRNTKQMVVKQYRAICLQLVVA